MAIYEWRGKATPLGHHFITTSHLTIDELAAEGEAWSAKGSIKVHDHIEGCETYDRWVATGTRAESLAVPQWVVTPDPAEGFHFTDEGGQALFTLLPATNVAIRTFVGAKLTALYQYRQQHPNEPIDLVDEMDRYAGPKHVYQGPCVCVLVESSNKKQPFDWLAHTGNGRHPANCFACSCGTNWYRGNPPEELWVRVAGGGVWEMLLEHNGEPAEYIAIDPQSPTPCLVLERTLRERGLIPFG